jgi:hypothetical protein
MEFGGRPAELGWFTTRYVEAEDESSAEMAVVALVRQDPKLFGVLDAPSDPPMIHPDEIEESPFVEAERRDDGFEFYGDDDSIWESSTPHNKTLHQTESRRVDGRPRCPPSLR